MADEWLSLAKLLRCNRLDGDGHQGFAASEGVHAYNLMHSSTRCINL